MLQPSLSGNARIYVISTINPEVSGVVESASTCSGSRRIGYETCVYIMVVLLLITLVSSIVEHDEGDRRHRGVDQAVPW